MPNENTLAGVACPNCGQEAEFEITAQATFDVTDEGTGDYHGVEWNGDSLIRCPKCRNAGLVRDFAPQESYVLIGEDKGIFLGELLGLAFWTRLDSVDQTEAPSLPKEQAQAIADLHKDESIKLHRIPTLPRYHTATELDAYGLADYTHELHANAAGKPLPA